MTRLRDIDTALRSLDAAHSQVDPDSARARAHLQRIVSADPSPDPLQQSWATPTGRAGRPRRAAPAPRRVALAAGVLAAVTAGVAALPSLSGGDQAFASWTPAPRGMTEQEAADAAASCRQMQQNGAGAEYADRLGSAEPVIAERRGLWTTVVLAAADGFSAMCIADDSTRLFADDMIGSVGTPSDYVPPGPRDLIATSLGAGTMKAGDLSLAAGVAGPDVVAVAYASRTHGTVAATVSQRHFALWLPGDEFKEASSSGVKVEVTYRDGSTHTARLTL